jgi:hypothetical protein
LRQLLRTHTGLSVLIWYGIAAAIIFGLQVFPITGVFLMFLAGPIWIGVLVHIMNLHLALCALPGIFARGWLLLPIAYYAGGFELHEVSVSRAHEQVDAMAKANQVSVKVEQPFSFLDKGYVGQRLLSHYKVERTFEPFGERFEARYVVQGDACEDAKNNSQHNKQPRFITSIGRNLGQGVTTQCIVLEIVPTLNARYSIEGTRTDGDIINPRYGQRYRLIDTTNNTTLVSVETATIMTLPPIQTIVAGCTLIGGPAADWPCGFGFAASSEPVRVGVGPIQTALDDPTIGLLARALSLEPRTSVTP